MVADERDASQALLDELWSRERIRELPCRYADAIERRDADGMAALFVPDARVGEFGTGRDAIRRLAADSLEDSIYAVIMVHNHIVDFEDADNATGTVWASCEAQDRDGEFIVQRIKYADRYRRHDGTWSFVHRRHHIWYGQVRSPSPLTQPVANWPASQVGVGDLPMRDEAFVAWRRSRS